MSIADANIQEEWKKDMEKEREGKLYVRVWLLRDDGGFQIEKGSFSKQDVGKPLTDGKDARKVVGMVFKGADFESDSDSCMMRLVYEAFKRNELVFPKNGSKNGSSLYMLMQNPDTGKVSVERHSGEAFGEGECIVVTNPQPLLLGYAKDKVGLEQLIKTVKHQKVAQKLEEKKGEVEKSVDTEFFQIEEKVRMEMK